MPDRRSYYREYSRNLRAKAREYKELMNTKRKCLNHPKIDTEMGRFCMNCLSDKIFEAVAWNYEKDMNKKPRKKGTGTNNEKPIDRCVVCRRSNVSLIFRPKMPVICGTCRRKTEGGSVNVC